MALWPRSRAICVIIRQSWVMDSLPFHSTGTFALAGIIRVKLLVLARAGIEESVSLEAGGSWICYRAVRLWIGANHNWPPKGDCSAPICASLPPFKVPQPVQAFCSHWLTWSDEHRHPHGIDAFLLACPGQLHPGLSRR